MRGMERGPYLYTLTNATIFIFVSLYPDYCHRNSIVHRGEFSIIPSLISVEKLIGRRVFTGWLKDDHVLIQSFVAPPSIHQILKLKISSFPNPAISKSLTLASLTSTRPNLTFPPSVVLSTLLHPSSSMQSSTPAPRSTCGRLVLFYTCSFVARCHLMISPCQHYMQRSSGG